MARYYYSRYYVNEIYSNYRNEHFVSEVRTWRTQYNTETYIGIKGVPFRKGKEFNFFPTSMFDTGGFALYEQPSAGSSQYSYPKVADVGWESTFHYVDPTRRFCYVSCITREVEEKDESGREYKRLQTRLSTYTCDYDTAYHRGSYIDDVTAESGTYPDNGESGGYWYVKGSRVNTAPNTPSSISVPSNLREGKSFQISWESSYDAEGDSITYKLERSINGGSYSQIYSGDSRSKYDTPQASWNTVRYRVRAYDGSLYSGYRYSNTVDEIKHFPEFKMCINGELKTSTDGWVKINGALRKIESIKVKVDGALKEV